MSMAQKSVSAPFAHRVIGWTVSVARPVISIGALLLIWELAVQFRWINGFLFPAPSAIFASLLADAGPGGDLWKHVGMSLYRLLAGMALAIVFGTLIGIAIGMTHWGRLIFKPIISALMPVPTLAWTPILLLIIGIDNRTTILVVFIAASFEVIYTIITGIEQMSSRVFWVARSMGATRMQIFWKVIVMGITPYLITGVKLGVGYGWRALIAAEMLAASSYGLGFMIFHASEYMAIEMIYGGIFCIAILGLLLENVVLRRIEIATVEKWGVQVER